MSRDRAAGAARTRRWVCASPLHPSTPPGLPVWSTRRQVLGLFARGGTVRVAGGVALVVIFLPRRSRTSF